MPVLQVLSYLVTFYIYSEPIWEQCTQFQNYTAQSLRAGGYKGPYSVTGRNSFTVEEFSDLKANVYSVETNRVGESPGSSLQCIGAVIMKCWPCANVCRDSRGDQCGAVV